MEIRPKPQFKTLDGLAVKQSNTLHLPLTLADITGTVWTNNLADREDECTERRHGGVGSGLIMALAVLLVNYRKGQVQTLGNRAAMLWIDTQRYTPYLL